MSLVLALWEIEAEDQVFKVLFNYTVTLMPTWARNPVSRIQTKQNRQTNNNNKTNPPQTNKANVTWREMLFRSVLSFPIDICPVATETIVLGWEHLLSSSPVFRTLGADQ